MGDRKGTISVKTNDVLPIIKKWLYSEHDIFIRELVANASDAITKRATLSLGKNTEVPTGRIEVILDNQAGTLTVSDNGLGMTEEEVEKYIAQLAFSGAEEFVKNLEKEGKAEKNDIIGKFGLGFYSAFMVATKVEVNTLSMNKGAKPTKWVSEGETEYTFTGSDKKEVGTEIVLHLNDESKEFLSAWKIRASLSNHCGFMPYEIFLIDLAQKAKMETEKANEKDEKKKAEMADYTPDLINNPKPLWKKDPNSLKDQDYKDFFRQLFPMDPEPLFWIHLNVDHPFTLQGILYFPKFNPQKPIQENNIKLFCKQVFVSDNVKNVIPEFLGLLKGAIDSTDIPLNVSRSALQGDPNITKISNYIVKKVAEALKKQFKNDRTRYEEIWQDIALFAKYGSVSDPKFDELMRPYVIFKNSEEKYVTLDEYRDSIPTAYADKLKGKVVYFNKEKSDPSLRTQLWEEKVAVIETDEYIDPHFMQQVEMKTGSAEKEEDKFQFVSIDSEFENILSDEKTGEKDNEIQDFFTKYLVPEKKEADPSQMEIVVKNFKNALAPAYFKVDEQMKRMQQMTQSMGPMGQSFPVKKTLVVNPTNPLIQNTLKIWEKGDNEELVKKLCYHVQDLANLSSDGLAATEKEQFVRRSQTLIQELSSFVIH